MGAVRITPGCFRNAEEVANLAAAAKRKTKLAGAGVVLHSGLYDTSAGTGTGALSILDTAANALAA